MDMNTKPKTLLAARRGIPVGAWVALVFSAGVSLASETEHRTVTGRLVAPPDCRWNLGETKVFLQEQLPPIPIPPYVKAKGRGAEDEWLKKWKTTEECQAFLSKPRRMRDVSVSNDGSFAIEKVVAGDYWLFYSFYDRFENDLLSIGTKPFSLSPGGTPVALGEIQMADRPRLRKGERAPRFEVAAMDGAVMKNEFILSCDVARIAQYELDTWEWPMPNEMKPTFRLSVFKSDE
jgi:hypothetical protein